MDDSDTELVPTENAFPLDGASLRMVPFANTV